MLISEALKGVRDTPGVIGCALFDASGVCVADELVPPYEPILLRSAVDQLQGALDAFTATGVEAPMSAFVVTTMEGQLWIRAIDDLELVVLSQPNFNPNLLNVAVTVAALNVRKTTKEASGLLPPPVVRAQTATGLVPRVLSPPPGPGASTEPVGMVAVRALLEILLTYIGPAGKAVLKQEIRAFGATPKTLNGAMWTQLVSNLANRISNSAWRTEFKAAASRILS